MPNKEPITIYPNPIKDVLNIKWSAGVKIEEMQMISVGGKMIDIRPIGNGRLDVSHLPTGLYYLVLRTNEKIIRKMLIKE